MTEEAIQTYKALSELPAYKSAQALRSSDGSTILHIQYSCIDGLTLKKRPVAQDVHFASPDQSLPTFSVPTDLPEQVIYQGISPCGKFVLLLRSVKEPGSNTSKRYIEIRSRTSARVVFNTDVTSLHADFRANETFGFPYWLSDGSGFAYVADSHLINPGADKSADRIQKFRWTPDFGEQLPARAPAIFFHKTKQELGAGEERIIRLTDAGADSTIVYAQPALAPAQGNRVRLLATGYSRTLDGRRLGLFYCQNRPSGIYTAVFDPADVSLDSEPGNKAARAPLTLQRLTQTSQSARSPRVTPDGALAVYLTNPSGGPHADCSALYVVSLDEPETPAPRLLVDYVAEPHSPGAFPGLYINQLPPRSFVKTGAGWTLVANSTWGSLDVVVGVDLGSGEVTRLSGSQHSYNVLCTDDDSKAFATRSCTASLPELVVSAGEQGSWQAIRSDPPPKGCDLDSLRSTIVTVPGEVPLELILTSRDASPTLPLILNPHGGPHSTSISEFSPATAAYALAGYRVVYVNYPGSLGYGSKWTSYLPPRLCHADVDACVAALDHLADEGKGETTQAEAKAKAKAKAKAYVMGGSHGGFIAAHLSARFGHRFAAAVMRNPVTDLVGTGSGASDIPDWTWAEVGRPYISAQVPPPSCVDPESYPALHRASPIAFLADASPGSIPPTLLLLGTHDQRVDKSQGLAWYHALKGKGASVDALVFEGEEHPLAGAEAQLTVFEATLKHFRDHPVT